MTKPEDRSRYEALLQEAAGIQGVSLGRDAWKRLCKNRAAVASLILVAGVIALAILTPLLPLQSPQYQDLEKRQFLPPTFAHNELPVSLAEIHAAEQEIADLRGKLAQATTADERQLEKDLESRHREHPFRRLWNELGPFNTALVRARIAVFGTWCIPSLCGTDSLGRDVLARICWGSRVSILVGLVATAVSLLIGVTYGAVSGFVGGWVDTVLMRFVDVMLSIPFVFVVIFILTVVSEPRNKEFLLRFNVGPLIVLCIVIGLFFWLTMARVVRGQVLSLKHEQFVDAARTIGAGLPRIVFRHLVPNILGIVIIYLTLTIPSVMLTEAFLSYLGLGVQAPNVSLGVLIEEGIRVMTSLKLYWWLVLFPAGLLATTLLALNFIGDGLRDALDPRLKNR